MVRGSPAGGGYATAPDVLRFAAALRRGVLLRPATLDQFTTGRVDPGPGGRHDYGFGDTTLNGHRIVGHAGGLPGISANLDMFWNDGWVVVVMSNMDAGAMVLVSKARERIATERERWQPAMLRATSVRIVLPWLDGGSMRVCMLVFGVWGMLACQPISARRGAGTAPPASAAFERACQERGESGACGRAAELYSEGENGQTFDPERSFHYATLGCDGGDGLACAVLGRLRESGIGTEWAPKLAVADYDKACAAGSGLGCALLAAMYVRGHGVDADPEKAQRYGARAQALWSAACQGAEPRWCTQAALLTGHGPDAEQLAQAYNRRACDHGFTRGCVRWLDSELASGTAKPSAVVGELSRLCDGGEPSACERLAGIERSDAQGDRGALRHAAELTVRACELGMAEACMEAGILSEAGEYLPQDDDAKLRYLGAACDRGRAEACLYLAQDAAERGASEREIERLHRRACELGNAEACSEAMQPAIARHDAAAVVRFATEACRMGGDDGCKELITRDTALPAVPHDQQLRDYQEVCNAGHAPACDQLARLEPADAASTQRQGSSPPPPGSEIGATPQNVPPQAFNAARLTGDLNIVPDNATKTVIATHTMGRVTGSFKVCLSSSGRIRSITTLRETGVPAYDQKLIRTMFGKWRYRPFMVDGVAAQVCTKVTFIYQQIYL